MLDYPIVVESENVKIKTEKMEVDKLYYCMYQDKILLFYKEQNDMLNCYEIAEKEVVEEVKQSQSTDIENILQRYVDKRSLNS